MNDAQALLFDVALFMAGVLFAASLDLTLKQSLRAVNITLLVAAVGVGHAICDDPNDPNDEPRWNE